MGTVTLPDPVVRIRQMRWSAGLGCLTSFMGAYVLPVEPWASVLLAVPSAGLAVYALWNVRTWTYERQQLGRWDSLMWRA